MSRLQCALEVQYALALERKLVPAEKSYTCYLYQQGMDKILKKCCEECFEVALAAKSGTPEELAGELNDVFYHTTVLLCLCEVPFAAVMADLNRRCRTEGADADEISRIIAARREEEGYTGYLFREGLDKLLKKVGEAVGLMLLAAKNADSDDIALQAGGLFYHLLAAMQCTAVNNELLADELERRGNRVGNLKQFHITDHST